MALNVHALVNTPGHPLTANEVLEAHIKVEAIEVYKTAAMCEQSLGKLNNHRPKSSHPKKKKNEKGGEFWLRLLDSY